MRDPSAEIMEERYFRPYMEWAGKLCDGKDCGKVVSANKRKCLNCIALERQQQLASIGQFMNTEELKRRIKNG